jgi:hypothetical protein
MAGSTRAVAELLAEANRLLGEKGVMLRCKAQVLETVYVELVDDSVVVHDHGQTWSWIVNHPDSERPWDDDLVQALSAERRVEIRREVHKGDVVRVQLQRTAHAEEDIATVVQAVADLMDAIHDAHTRHGGWRHWD